jgi:hypothetical protein
MIIARFGPSTAWNGRTIVWEDGRFVLQDHGEVPAQALLDYDRQGQLVWEYDGLREWVTGVAAAAAPAAGARYPEGALLGGHSPRFPIWAIVLIVAAAFVLIGGIFAAIAIPMFLDQRDLAKESAVREGVHSLQIGVQSWAVDHEDEYPDPAIVSPSGMGLYVDNWPTNPYTGLPMTQGTGPGQFTYSVSGGGAEFQITAYGSGGAALITVPK